MSAKTKMKSTATRKAQARPKAIRDSSAKPLLIDVRALILEARQRVAQTVNAGLTLLYWQIGYRIRQDILKEKRAEYGAEIVQSLTGQLTAEFGRGFAEKTSVGWCSLLRYFRIRKLSQHCCDNWGGPISPC